MKTKSDRKTKLDRSNIQRIAPRTGRPSLSISDLYRFLAPNLLVHAMPAIYEIRYLPRGNTEEYYGSRGNYYEFDDGSHIEVRSRLVWCRRCGQYADGESIESLDEIDRQLADLEDPRSDLYRFTQKSLSKPGGGFRRYWIELTKQRRQWRERRVSAAAVPALRLDRPRVASGKGGGAQSLRRGDGRPERRRPLQYLVQRVVLHARRRADPEGDAADVLGPRRVTILNFRGIEIPATVRVGSRRTTTSGSVSAVLASENSVNETQILTKL